MRVKDLKGYDGEELPFRLDAEDVIDIAENNNLGELELREAILIGIYTEIRRIRVQLEDN